MNKLKVGSFALMGKDKEKRIYLGEFNGRHLAVIDGHEELFKKGEGFYTACWDSAEPLHEEPKLYYKFKRKGNRRLAVTASYYPLGWGHDFWEPIMSTGTTYKDLV